MRKLGILVAATLFISTFGRAQELNVESSKIKVRAIAELGYLGVLDHKIQFSQNGTYVNYVTEGGQSTLFPFSRLSLELDLGPKNTLVLLYQPLKIQTQGLPERDLIVDGMTFPASEGVNFLYDFPFYRLSYLREFLSDNPKYDFAFGATVQIRNTTISFESTDGSRFRTNTNIGIVPTLKLKAKRHFSSSFYTAFEADGFYAPVSYLNGSDDEIIGAILDASLRAGYSLAKPVDGFLNLRYLGGGAVGTNTDSEGPGDGYTRNWLHFLTVTTGFVYKFD